MSERTDLRTEHATAARARTRQRILNALARTVGEGSFPPIAAVARTAGVSVPTIYRHFENREGLLAAVSDYVDEQFDLVRIRGVEYHYSELVARLGRLYRADHISDNGLVALFSTDVGLPIWREQCELARPGVVAALREEHPDADDQSLERLTDMMMVLLAIASVQVLRDVLGRSAAEAGDTVQWAFEALVAAAKAPKT